MAYSQFQGAVQEYKELIEEDDNSTSLSLKPKGVAAISQIDAEILTEIQFALEQLGEDYLLEILKQYKIVNDKKLLSRLKHYNIEFEDDEEREDVPKYGRKFIKILDIVVEAKMIQIMKPFNFYNAGTNEVEYQIVINPDPKEVIPYHNTVITFVTEDQRRIEMAKTKKRLEKFNIVFL